jgi:hypothetical protein
MSIPSRRGPKPLSEILGELFTARGYGQIRARAELETAWANAVGEPACRQTELGEVRRGVLNVTVAHPALLEELSAFGKAKILSALRTEAAATTIHDIRFRVGALGATTVADTPAPRAKPSRTRAAAMGPPEPGLENGGTMARRDARRMKKNPPEGDTENNTTGSSGA